MDKFLILTSLSLALSVVVIIFSVLIIIDRVIKKKDTRRNQLIVVVVAFCEVGLNLVLGDWLFVALWFIGGGLGLLILIKPIIIIKKIQIQQVLLSVILGMLFSPIIFNYSISPFNLLIVIILVLITYGLSVSTDMDTFKIWMIIPENPQKKDGEN